VDLISGVYMGVHEDDERLPATGFLLFQRCFVLKNPVPETLAGHGLRAITGVFGVLFQLLGNFLKITYQINLIIRFTKKNIFSDRKKP
jgi:hypothetical protein